MLDPPAVASAVITVFGFGPVAVVPGSFPRYSFYPATAFVLDVPGEISNVIPVRSV